MRLQVHPEPPVITVSREFLRRSFWMILLIVLAYVYVDYWAYSVASHRYPQDMILLSSGRGPAPAQYRVALVYGAVYLGRLAHGHLSYRHFFTLFDLISLLLSSFLVRGVLLRTTAFRAAGQVSQYLRLALMLALMLYYLSWSFGYQRPETITCALYVAASVYLISAVRSGAAVFIGLVVLSVLQGFVRSDVSILFDFALFVYVLFRGARHFFVSRAALLAGSGLGCVLSTAALWLLMHRIFPHATYGDTRVIQFFLNFAPDSLLAFLLFIVPVAYTYLKGLPNADVGRGQRDTLLLAAAFYLVSWMVMGRIMEVRIFFPFAFALIPQTVNALAARMEPSAAA